MNLITRLRQMFNTQDDTPEIIEDIFERHTDAELLEIFHTELEILADTRGIGYFEAFVEHIRNSNVNVHNRGAVEDYLWRHGLCDSDVKQLTDKLYEIVTYTG